MVTEVELLDRISAGENARTEFKKSAPARDVLASAVVALANEPGEGWLVLGVDDDGAIIGVLGAEELPRYLEGICQEQVRPPIKPDIDVVPLREGTVVVLRVLGHSEQGPYQTARDEYFLRTPGGGEVATTRDDAFRHYQSTFRVRRPLLKHLHVERFMSLYEVDLTLKPLTIIIGPNASGKSNLVRALDFLQAGMVGQASRWEAYLKQADRVFWFGDVERDAPVRSQLRLEFSAELPEQIGTTAPRYGFRVTRQLDESLDITTEHLDFGLRPAEVAQSYFSRDAGRITQIRVEEEQVRETRAAFDQPQRLYFREYAGSFPHPTADGLARFVRGWRFMDVDVSSARRASPDLVPEGVSALLPDASNLSAVLYSLGNRSPERFEEIEYRLGRAIGFPQSIETEKVATLGGSGEARYGFRELAFPGRVIPPEAMSDGTIRLLANLTAVLGDPDARLICIEEPDHGLHPHLMLRLADAMRAAAAAEPAEGFVPPQVLVVTHSPDFLDCFNLAAEAGYLAVYVAERSIEDGKTTFRSTEAADLQPWLEEYRLGEAVRRNIL